MVGKSTPGSVTREMSDSGYSARYREYVGAVWELEEQGIPVIQARIADWLGVSRASVSEMIRKLEDEGLLRAGDSIELTPEGKHLAEIVIRRHRLAEAFLANVLRLPWAKVHQEAEVWETVISDDVEQAMWAALDDPKTCPHGNPIPGAGYIPPPMTPILDMEPGETAYLERISEELEFDAEMMRYLDEAGLHPGATVEMKGRDPHQALTVVVNGTPVGVGAFAAERLFVTQG